MSCFYGTGKGLARFHIFLNVNLVFTNNLIDTHISINYLRPKEERN